MMQIDIKNFERSILSSFLFESETLEDNISKLKPNDFSLEAHSEIYRVMTNLYNNDLPIDEDFIIKYADDKKLTHNEILEVMSVNPVVNVAAYIEMLLEDSVKRKLLNLSNSIKAELLDDSSGSEDIKTRIVNYIDNIEKSDIDKYEHKSSDLLDKIKNEMDDFHKGIKKEKFYTGLEKLDNILDGIEDGDLVVIAARPSMGKTSIIASICIETMEKNHGVLIESLEMPADKIMRRLLSVHSKEYLSDIKKALLKSPDKFNQSLEFLNSNNLIIHDETYPTLYKLQARIKRTLRKNPHIKNIFIDHTGKIQLAGKTREDIEIGHITNSLKKIARDHNIRIFLLQQLNRGVENRDNKRPTLSDIKNSGNVEEDADIVLGLYRDSYYKTKDKDEIESDLEEAEIIVLKNRDGALGTAKVWFERKTTSFVNKKTYDKNSIIQFN